MSHSKLAGPPNSETEFSPDTFLLVPPRTFEDLQVGEIFRAPSRTLTDAHTLAFQAISMDNHPRHFNKDYAEGHKLQGPLVHPLQVLCFTALGATLLTHYIGEVLIAFTDVSATFIRDSFVGDTLYSALEIIELSTEGGKGHVLVAATIFNQRHELVLSGQQKLVLRLSPAA